jgi:UDP-glucuronate 4-epimerase
MSTYLVTGGAGFIGSHVIHALLRDGHTVVNIDSMNDYYDPTLKRARLARLEDSITHYEIDIADERALEEVFKKHQFDAVCHLAAQAGVRYSIENPFIYARSNYVGTLNIFEYAKRYAVSHVVAASTSSVYGLNDTMPFIETDRVDTPVSIYAATKRGTELLAHAYHHLFDMHITMLRFFTVYGPWGRPDMALFKFTKAILAGEPIPVFNGGDMKRDFTYVDDIVSGVVSALEHPSGFKMYNLGKGSPTDLMEYIHTIEDAVGKKALLDMQPMQPGDVHATWADITAAQADLGYHPKTSVSLGVPQFVEWYRSYYSS